MTTLPMPKIGKLKLRDVAMFLMAPLPLLLAWVLHDLLRTISEMQSVLMCLLFVPFALAFPAIAGLYFYWRYRTARLGPVDVASNLQR